MPRLTYQQAIVTAIQEEMIRDPSVFLIGQDIGPFEGALQSTKGLWSEFGASGRIVETSLTEAAMIGMGVGAAVMGMRPIVEFMFAEFLGLGMQSLAIDAAGMHYFSAGEMRVPLVLRLKCGISPHLGHKQDLHPWLMSVPGIKVVLPSSPYDAKGLMKAAIRDPNPVVVFEHMHLYHGARQEVPSEDYVLPLGVSEVKRAGRDDRRDRSHGQPCARCRERPRETGHRSGDRRSTHAASAGHCHDRRVRAQDGTTRDRT